jgi:VIT1/CCC1 family predicted Fe2+/Mn2+ transporter
MQSTKRIAEAKQAFLTNDIRRSAKVHAPDAVAAPEEHKGGLELVKSAVYGGVDGIITTASLVFSALENHVSPTVVIILVLANGIADGLSMALSDYLSSKSEKEYIEAEKAREQWEVENYPEGEKKEMMEIYQEKGMSESDAQIMVDALARNKEAWVEIMMIEELGLVQTDESPIKNGITTFVSFILFGMIPILPRFISQAFMPIDLLTSSLVVTLMTLFFLGAMKTKITGKNWVLSGLETLLLGGIATGLAFLISYFLGG